MSFASPLFLWYFLPVVLAAVLIAPRSGRNAVLAVASLVFYASGAGGTTLLLLVCIVVNYLAGLRLEPRPDRDARNRKLLLAATVAVNLTILFIWKYAGFATALGPRWGVLSVPPFLILGLIVLLKVREPRSGQ